jgi:hypothetical protein
MGPGDLQDYISNLHPDQFARGWVAYPYGGPPGGRTENWNSTRVLVVEVVKGDLNQIRHDLQSRYTGNLCVIESPGKPTIADEKRLVAHADQVLTPLFEDRRNGIFASSVMPDSINVQMVMLTPELYGKIAKLGAVLDPWLRPVGK